MRLPVPSHRFFNRFGSRLSWLGTAAVISTGMVVIAGTSAIAQETVETSTGRTALFDLNRAVCSNDWDHALILTSNLLGSDAIDNAERTELIALRRQMEQIRAGGSLATDVQACDRTNPYFLNAEMPNEDEQAVVPLGWAGAIAEVTENQFSSEVITESSVMTLPVRLTNQAGLTPAEPMDLSRGLTAVSGHVGAGHNVYAFVAGMGDRVDINLEVTRVMTGSLYTTGDSQLFVFDKSGKLLAAADDTSESTESRINDWTVPSTDVYFAVVTSYNNDPIFNQDNRVVSWRDNGGGRFDYTLSVSGATPTNALVR